MGAQLTPIKRGHSRLRTFRPMYCGQSAGWIKMPLGIKVEICPGHIVLDRDPASLPKGAQPPIFGPCLLRPNGWMDQDTTWYVATEVEICPGHTVLDGDPASLSKGAQTPNFRSMSVAAKRLNVSRCHSVRIEAGLGHAGDIMLDRDPVTPTPKRGKHSRLPHFLEILNDLERRNERYFAIFQRNR